MIKIYLFIFCFLINNNLYANNYIDFNNFEDNKLVNFNSKDGKKRLKKSKYKEDFYQLAPNFQPQINPLYCGIASSVIILNSLSNDRPNQEELQIYYPSDLGEKKIHFNLYSQLSFFNEETHKIKPKQVVDFKLKNKSGKFDPGLTLNQLKLLLEHYKANVELFYADNKIVTVESFRNHLEVILKDDNNFLLANFHGKTFGATTSGHISPIAAYDKKTDSILLLDVASHKNPWYWVDVNSFFNAMNSIDGNNFRGYLIIN